MNCPKCKLETQNYRTHDSQELNFCRTCGGTWFDKGELAWMMASESDILAGKEAMKRGNATDIRCSSCDAADLVEVKYHSKHDLLIDVCPSCHGVFLDAKEIGKAEKIAASTEGGHIRLARALMRMKEAGYIPIGKIK